jgi:organic hydroperoxide reductase OsmC/OhrA
MSDEHSVRIHWEGSTTSEYTRDAIVSADGKPALPVSAGSQYLGDPQRWNPEDLFAASLSTCHMLTFLALAKKVGLDVRRYDEFATATLDKIGRFTRVVRVRLAPRIAVAPGTDEAKVREMFAKAHKYCFIANSTTAEVVLEPSVEQL